jgi:ketol-acid reductoisomerase
MTVVFHEDDGDIAALYGKRIGIIGYGNMGRPVALNLRDSGLDVLISEPRDEKQTQARDDNFLILPVPELVTTCDVIMPLLRDEDMPKVYLEDVSPHLRRDHALIFSSAYNVAFGFIEAPPFVDVGLVSARTLGTAVRERYVSGAGFASFVAVAQDSSRHAWGIVLAIARAMGALRGGAVEIRFEQEAELDLYMQQTILPIFHHIIIASAELLMARGYPPEAVFTELYLSGETADYLKHAAQFGLMAALQGQSLPAQYGILSRYERFKDAKVERLLELALEDIRGGKFAQEWAKEYGASYPRLRALLKQRAAMDLWELEQQTVEFLRGDL